jgi:demethylmenaquinone methyltransferase/2-methoxy-6-polyprenyl-1,4-benzoquinol methylase
VTVWNEVEEALETIIDDYEKVNHVISLFQDDRARLIGLQKVGKTRGTALELGSGPGNYSRMINNFHGGELVCLDFSYKMHLTARKRNMYLGHHYVRAVFEALPIRRKSVDFVSAAFALRDSLNKPLAIKEACDAISPRGKFLLTDIGKPDNVILQGFMTLFMKYVVPVMGGLTAGYGFRNPWSTLFKTYVKLPPNRVLVSIIESNIDVVDIEEQILGALLIILGVK